VTFQIGDRVRVREEWLDRGFRAFAGEEYLVIEPDRGGDQSEPEVGVSYPVDSRGNPGNSKWSSHYALLESQLELCRPLEHAPEEDV